MITEAQIEKLIQNYPDRRFCIHNGYNGWSYGSPLNPRFITVDAARKILNFIAQVESVNVLEEVQRDHPPLQYAEEGDDLYERTGGNRFIAFLDPEMCSYDEEYKGVEVKELHL